MFFSIVIPLYNKEKYIEATLQSVLAQTWQDYEVLIVDDGSTDKSVTLVEPFLADSRFNVIAQPNAGVSVARNTGIRKAQGEFVCFLDADDIWYPGYLQTVYDAIQQHPNTRMTITGHHTFEVTPTQPKYHRTLERYFAEDVKNLDFFEYCVKTGGSIAQTSCVTIRRTVLQNGHVEFRKGCSMGEDLDVFVRAAAGGKVLYINHPLVAYRYDMNEGLMGRGKSIMASYPYWEWYAVNAISHYKDIYTSLAIYNLARKGLNGGEYALVRECLQRIQGSAFMMKRIMLNIRAWLHL